MDALKFVSGIFMLLCLIPAILKRKHCSKYKHIFKWIPVKIRNEVMARLRKKDALNQKQLEEETEHFFAELLEKGMKWLFVISAIFFVLSWIKIPEKDGDKIRRPAEGSGAIESQIILSDPQGERGEEIVRLEIQAREMTAEEFKVAFSKVKEEIWTNVLGQIEEGVSEKHPGETVRSDVFGDQVEILGEEIELHRDTKEIKFQSTDDSGLLKISWTSDQADLFSSSGLIDWDLLKSSQHVLMVGEITDGQHSKKVGISFALIFDEADKSQLEKAKEELVRIEEESRTSGEIEVPDTLEGYQVHVEKTDVKEKLFWIYGLSILIIGILLEVELVHLKEAGERRDESLRAEYYQFLNRLSLYLATGMSVKEAFRRLSIRVRADALVAELKFTVRRMELGASEMEAIEEMGRNIGLAEYMRLSSLVTQNLRHGNAGLLKQLEAEVQQGMIHDQERVRKESAKASEKLMIPTFILLILVIAIVLIPAVMNL